MKHKKILLITNNFPPISCGVGDYTYNIGKEFINEGHDVAIICRDDKRISDYWNKTNEGFTVHTAGGNWTIEDWKKVLNLVSKLSVDNLIFQYVPGSYNKYTVPLSLLYFFNKLKKTEVKVITTFHETYVRYNWSHPKYLYVALGQRIIARHVAKKSDKLITSIDRYKDQLERWNSNINLIPIGSNIIPVEVLISDILEVRKTIAPKGETVFCTFGNRNHELLLELFKKILNIKPESTLLIIGKVNADLSTLTKSVRNQIYTTGFLEANEVFKYLKSSNAFIMLDKVGEKGNGGTCNKSGSLAAGFAAKLPVFATKGDMTNRLLIEESGIEFIPYTNINKAAELIVSHMENEQYRAKKIKQSEIFYLKFLSYNKIITEYLKF
ncbi:glycosyltransferase family 4 protein [Winogradskyella ludwigii]|uniref:glycosyltransferase family 4 protein n=1 Tax=Winogradskyella ludwigii TaxID=2686076 RepID=UPI0015CC30DB|nr:glycosyltransferase family 4 protein [Winogradskyella ludwigii]